MTSQNKMAYSIWGTLIYLLCCEHTNGEVLEGKEDCQDTDVFLLDKSDIPGASLNGKSPSELNITQLKRWLAPRKREKARVN